MRSFSFIAWWTVICCSAVVRAFVFIERHDIDHNALRQGKRLYTPSKILPQLDRRQSNSNDTSTTANSTMTLKFLCKVGTLRSEWTPRRVDLPSIQDNVCTKAHATFLRAMQRIQNVVYLQTPVVVEATISSFCASSTNVATCRATTDVLGSAGPASWLEWNSTIADAVGVDADYLYPSALAKQYAPDEFPDPDSADITASFNSEPLWWFPTREDPIGNPESDSWNAKYAWASQWEGYSSNLRPAKFKDRIFDFEQIVLHELLHGLGFISSWYTWADDDGILPSYGRVAGNGTFQGLAKPYIYNKWMMDVNKGIWMYEYERNITREVQRLATSMSLTSTSWVNALKRSATYATCQDLYDRVATNLGALAVFYPISAGLPANVSLAFAVLYTPKTFSDGSTFSHLSPQAYSGSRNFLMRPFGTAGTSLDQFRPTGEPIGEIVLGILRSMGYATALQPLG
ncbi:hypothetical protein DFS34DRAFT_615417 [Phlyctochytrium arcticum]|nr:hypothetical protein DFS34DRAFT_615417 [Phlyctochytrium arcticum]